MGGSRCVLDLHSATVSLDLEQYTLQQGDLADLRGE